MTDRWRRWLTHASIASAALAAALILLIVRGWFVCDTFSVATTSGVWQAQLHRGGLFVQLVEWSRARGMTLAGTAWTSERAAGARVWPEWNVQGWDEELIFGFGLTAGNGFTITRVPLLYPAAMLLILPIWWSRHPRRRRRPRFGTCAACGYDLRGSSERCPECGQPFERAKIVALPPTARQARL